MTAISRIECSRRNPALRQTSLTNCWICYLRLSTFNPMELTTVPQTARGIIDRVDEISFNSTFMLELGDRNLQDRSRCAWGRGSEPLEIGEPIVK
jgi:hypothetical protein